MIIFVRFASSLVRKVVRVLPVILAVAVADWTLKAGVIATGQRYQFRWAYEKGYSWLTLLVAIVGLGAMISWAEHRLDRLGVGLILGAGLGNYGEIVALGRVTDFIPFPAGHLASPADVCAVAGVALFVVQSFLSVRESGRRRRPAEAS